MVTIKREKKEEPKGKEFECYSCHNSFILSEDLSEDYKEKGYISFKCPHCRKNLELGKKKASIDEPRKKSKSWIWVIIGIIILILIINVFLSGVQTRSGVTCRTYTVEKSRCDEDTNCNCIEKALWGVGWCKKCQCTSCVGD